MAPMEALLARRLAEFPGRAAARAIRAAAAEVLVADSREWALITSRLRLESERGRNSFRVSPVTMLVRPWSRSLREPTSCKGASLFPLAAHCRNIQLFTVLRGQSSRAGCDGFRLTGIGS